MQKEKNRKLPAHFKPQPLSTARHERRTTGATFEPGITLDKINAFRGVSRTLDHNGMDLSWGSLLDPRTFRPIISQEFFDTIPGNLPYELIDDVGMAIASDPSGILYCMDSMGIKPSSIKSIDGCMFYLEEDHVLLLYQVQTGDSSHPIVVRVNRKPGKESHQKTLEECAYLSLLSSAYEESKDRIPNTLSFQKPIGFGTTPMPTVTPGAPADILSWYATPYAPGLSLKFVASGQHVETTPVFFGVLSSSAFEDGFNTQDESFIDDIGKFFKTFCSQRAINLNDPELASKWFLNSDLGERFKGWAHDYILAQAVQYLLMDKVFPEEGRTPLTRSWLTQVGHNSLKLTLNGIGGSRIVSMDEDTWIHCVRTQHESHIQLARALEIENRFFPFQYLKLSFFYSCLEEAKRMLGK